MTSVRNNPSESFVRVAPAGVKLEPSRIPADWILSGAPQAWNNEVAGSHDRMSQIIVWECTEGHFKWRYDKDETVIVISGEAFLIQENGEEHRFGPGDVGFFPAGTTCTWRVPGLFRKVAVMREPMWRPLGIAVKAWNRFLSVAGVTRNPRFAFVSHRTLIETPR